MRPTIVPALLLVSCLASATQAADCNSFAVRVATDPVPYQYPRGLEKAETLLGRLPTDADTILIGDSLVANWPQDMAQRQFASGAVWNFAVGGSLTQNTLWQLGRLRGDRPRPSRIVVLVGTNNLTRDDMPACAIAAGIKAVVALAHAKWPHAALHVMGMPPRGADFHFRDAARQAVNAEVSAWADKTDHVHYFAVDDDTMTCGLHGRPLQIANAGAMMRHSQCDNYADDFGHFKRSGYEVIFAAMTRAGP